MFVWSLAYNSRTWEAEAWGSQIQGLHRLKYKYKPARVSEWGHVSTPHPPKKKPLEHWHQPHWLVLTAPFTVIKNLNENKTLMTPSLQTMDSFWSVMGIVTVIWAPSFPLLTHCVLANTLTVLALKILSKATLGSVGGGRRCLSSLCKDLDSASSITGGRVNSGLCHPL